MKKFCLTLILCFVIPFIFVACENKDKNILSTPENFQIEEGIVKFNRVKDAEYYTLVIDNVPIAISSTSNHYVELTNDVNGNYFAYDATRLFKFGKSYTVKVCANAENKKSSDFVSINYTHTVKLATPTAQINGSVLTWDMVQNASSYLVVSKTPYDTTTEGTTYQFSTNKFDFSSILTSAGEYKFSVMAISGDNQHSNSEYSSTQNYVNYKQLSTPICSAINEDNNGNLHLVAVVDENASSVVININNISQTLYLGQDEDISAYVDEDLTSGDNETIDNVWDINLTNIINRLTASHSELATAGQYTVTIQAVGNSYYLNSSISNFVSYENYIKLSAPTISLQGENNNYVVVWETDEDAKNCSGYELFVVTDDERISKFSLNNTINSFKLPSNFISASLLKTGKGNFLPSNLSNFVSTIQTEYENEVVFNVSGSSSLLWYNLEVNDNSLDFYNKAGDILTWSNIADNYIVQIDNQIIYTTENHLSLLNYSNKIKQIKITAISSIFAPITFNLNLDYAIRLNAPTNYGFSTTNLYNLTISNVENALGYYVYIQGSALDDETATAPFVKVKHIFCTTVIDVSNYINTTASTNYNKYNVYVQAMADKYGLYTSSNRSQSSSVLHGQTLMSPQFANSPVTTEAGKTYLNFTGVPYSSSYEILINHNLITLSSAVVGIADIKVDITNYIVGAGSYQISVRAISSSDYIKSSDYNKYTYTLSLQLNMVTNIQINENDGVYTLTFNMLDDAASYSVRIVRVNDNSYNDYLTTLGLTNPFEVVQAVDITNYLQQAGEYNVYITAIAKAGSFYVDSDESRTPGTINKLTTLKVPTNIEFANASATEFYVRFNGDEHADYYMIRVINPIGQISEFRCYDSTKYNINDTITTQGQYAVSVKAMVNSTGENSQSYSSSPYSEDSYLNYNYQNEWDFERYSVYMYGEYYNFKITNVNQLMNVLWHHYVFKANGSDELRLFINVEEGKDLRTSIINLADDADTQNLYNFNLDAEYLDLLTNGTDGMILSLICQKLLGLYPDIAVLNWIDYSHTAGSKIFVCHYTNQLAEEEKIDTDPNCILLPEKDYGDAFSYLPMSARRANGSAFAIDSKPTMNVETSEQLLQAVQFNRQPNFVGNSSEAEKIYSNAKGLLRTIVSANMSELEKATAIFNWLEHAYNLNYYATYVYKNVSIVAGDMSEYGVRKEFYLEGIFSSLNDTTAGGFDGEFYLGSGNATSYSYSKAFTLLCAIEGIDTRMVYGNYSYSLGAINGNNNHVYNKININTSSEGNLKNWYAVDVTMSDNVPNWSNLNNSYAMSSHIYFLVTDVFLANNLNLTTNAIVKNNSCTTYFNYYANSTFGLTTSQIANAIKVNITDITNFTYTMNYINMQYQTYGGVSEGYSQLQAFVFNALMYAKYKQMYVNRSGVAMFEIRISESAMNSSTLPLGSTLEDILQTLNQYFAHDGAVTAERLKLTTFKGTSGVYDSVEGLTTYVFMVEADN